MSHRVERVIADRNLTIEVGKLAQQADSSVTVRYGNTVTLVTVCAKKEEQEEKVDFIPLTVDYEERLYAAGKIPGGFIRREGRPSEEATLNCRRIDRSLRPLLSKDFNHAIQVIAIVLSADKENNPNTCALIGASAALLMSDIPFYGPISVVHVGYIDNNMMLNPTFTQIEDSLFDLVVVSSKDAIVMVEAGAKEASEDLMMEAIKFGHEANQEIIKLQEELVQVCGKPKIEPEAKEVAPELLTQVSSLVEDKLSQILEQTKEKTQREQALAQVKEDLKQKLIDSFPEKEIELAFETKLKAVVRKMVLEKKQHLDGRKADQIRLISSEVSLLPRTHGSALFARGATQVLTVTTLGSIGQEQLLDGLGLEETKRFLHHYNFAPFSTGEVKRIGSPGRREIGHGALVERAIAPVLPGEEDFHYTIRLVSEVFSSSGSTSMASACAASLSLMDAGVPVKAPVAGIAVGLVADENQYVLLTDIEGMEDAYGDMDLKVAGTAEGITALQLDIKLEGIEHRILSEAVERARQARLEILSKMHETLSTSRSELSPYAPRMYQMTIDPSKIGFVIGTGGRTIRSIIEETKASIDIKNDGTVLIGSPSEEAAQKAMDRIKNLTQDIKLGEIYTGKVTRVLNFGAMVEIIPGKEGLVHISELAPHYVARVEDVVKVGDEIMVKVIQIDELGRINLSRKAISEGPSQLSNVRIEASSAPKRPGQRETRQRYSGRHEKDNT